MKNEFRFPSTDGRNQIHVIEWVPEGEVRGVVQIIHGMVEFIDRYDRFARVLNEAGYYVVGDDHLGHGATPANEEDYGYFGEPDGCALVLGDIRRLYELTKEKYPEVPYVMMGHSMGSFFCRQYINLYSDELAGAIVMGTGYQSPMTLKIAKFVAKNSAKRKGWRFRNATLVKMSMGAYNKRIKPLRTPVDWLTKDEAIVDAYVKNPWNNFMFTNNAYYGMFSCIEQCEKDANLQRIRKDLPVLIVSGAEDPVGSYGAGVKKVYEEYRRVGLTNAQMILYPNDRHEILNETDHEVVDKDILDWLALIAK